MYIFNEIPIKNVNVNETIMKKPFQRKKRRKRKEKLFYSYFDVFIYRKNLYFVIYHGGTFRFRWDFDVACEKNHEIFKFEKSEENRDKLFFDREHLCFELEYFWRSELTFFF